MVKQIDPPRSKSMNGELFSGAYQGKRVLVTGHTGFKGSWLTWWLHRLGAKVHGYSLPSDTVPNHASQLPQHLSSELLGDIREAQQLHDYVQKVQPEIIFHLAAQPLVRRSYREPEETFSTNVIGTLHLLQAARSCESVDAFVCVTSDKVYENLESTDGYRESDRLGGSDPYSCSKACAELVASSFRNSYWNLNQYGKTHHCLLATVRAGNVIGGGDWSEDRLIPDAVRAVTSGAILTIRSPSSVRPWQHVLEPLSGYLQVGERLLKKDPTSATAWNFGPSETDDVSVGEVIEAFAESWPELKYQIQIDPNAPHETKFLKVLSNQAKERLHWQPVWGWRQAVQTTAQWYREFHRHQKVLTQDQLDSYHNQASQIGLPWV
jgi:CDP-glucose 4,6-dehydratase